MANGGDVGGLLVGQLRSVQGLACADSCHAIVQRGEAVVSARNVGDAQTIGVVSCTWLLAWYF